MKDIKYRYANNELGERVNIADVTDEYRKAHTFYCIVCGDVMIASIKEGHRVRHFKHKNNKECNGETYLHQLAKLLFKESYEKKDKVELEYGRFYDCNNKECPLRHDACEDRRETHTVNLKEWYPYCELEKEVIGKDGNRYIADLLLSSDKKGVPPVLIEMFVSHECSIEKKTSGLWIVELNIRSQEQLEILCSSPKFIRDNDVILYNFETKKQKKLISKLYRYVQMPDNSTYLKEITCDTAKDIIDTDSKLEINIVSHNLHSPTLIKKCVDFRFHLNERKCSDCYYRRCDYLEIKEVPESILNFLRHYCWAVNPNIKEESTPCTYFRPSYPDGIEFSDYQFLNKQVVKGGYPEDYMVFVAGPKKFHNNRIYEEYLQNNLFSKLHNSRLLLASWFRNGNDNFLCNTIDFAEKYGIPLHCYAIDWKKGKREGYNVNTEILKAAKEIIYFSGEDDKLVLDLIDRAIKKHIPVHKICLEGLENICPKCGGILRPRHGITTFWGCINYPYCKFTKPYIPNEE